MRVRKEGYIEEEKKGLWKDVLMNEIIEEKDKIRKLKEKKRMGRGE